MKASLAHSGPSLAPAALPAARTMDHCAWLLGEAAGIPVSAGSGAEWRQNQLLAGLPPALRQRWAGQASSVYLKAGQTLHEAGALLQWVYFPVSALVSLSMQDRNGITSEVATVGREGVVGLPLLDGNYTRSRAVVQGAGLAVRLRASTLADDFAHQPAVRELLLAYSQALVAEIMQIAMCARHHTVEQQLSRLLLLRLDRQPGDTLSMTQEAMAGMLGVRRESVTLSAARLQQAGLIRYARGHIAVLDRHGLHARSCDCYDTLRHEFDRLLKPRPQVA